MLREVRIWCDAAPDHDPKMFRKVRALEKNANSATAASLLMFCVVSKERSTHPVPPVAGVVTVGIAGEVVHGCYRGRFIGE